MLYIFENGVVEIIEDNLFVWFESGDGKGKMLIWVELVRVLEYFEDFGVWVEWVCS